MQKKVKNWNAEYFKNSVYTSPQNETFCVKHLANITVDLLFQYKCADTKQKIKGKVKAVVIFDGHCFTRTKTAADTDPVILVESYDDNSTERVFCRTRYDFSKKLVTIIKGLSYKTCRESTTFGKAIRLEDQSSKNPKQGVYIVIKVRPNRKLKTLMLYVETAHERNNEPHSANLLKEPRRYQLILGDWIKSGKKGYDIFRP